MVDFAALKRHREQNIRVQERVPEKTGSEDDEASALRRRERLAAAEKAELELAKAKDEVISRVAVERAIQSAAAAFRQAHQRTRFARANALEATRDARDKARVLAEQDAEVERAFAQALSTLASPLSEEQEADAAEQQEFEEAANTGRAESAREDGAAPSNS